MGKYRSSRFKKDEIITSIVYDKDRYSTDKYSKDLKKINKAIKEGKLHVCSIYADQNNIPAYIIMDN